MNLPSSSSVSGGRGSDFTEPSAPFHTATIEGETNKKSSNNNRRELEVWVKALPRGLPSWKKIEM